MQHASHKSRLPDIERLGAQLKNIALMVEDERYCLDIITALKGVRRELKEFQNGVLQDHLDHCLERAAAADGDPAEKTKLTAEVMKLLEVTAS
jgi:DNA-binding FrmR family transcriptional regulator